MLIRQLNRISRTMCTGSRRLVTTGVYGSRFKCAMDINSNVVFGNVKIAGKRLLSASVTKGSGEQGLTGSIPDPYITHNLDLVDTVNLVSNFDKIFRRAIEDDLKSQTNPTSALQYLEVVAQNVGNFTSTGGVVGRLKERKRVMDYFQKKGTMAFICGGPSVGKTRLVNDIIQAKQLMQNNDDGAGKPMPMRIVRFDGRAVSSLRKALDMAWYKALQEEMETGGDSANASTILGRMVEVDVDGYKIKMPYHNGSDVYNGSDVAVVRECVSVLVEQAHNNGEHLVLVLDEANAFLKTTSKDAEETAKLFNTLVLYTKQTKRMSVVLLSHDEGLPFRLQSELGLKTAHISDMLATGEATSSEMLLQLEELGMGQHLRELLVRVYGGHIWEIHLALFSLKMDLKDGSEVDVLRGQMNSIKNAFALWAEQKGNRKELVDVLKEVARCGFCPLDKNDKLTRVLVKSNTCIFLADGVDEYFIDPKVRCAESGVTAATHLVRVLIPVVLQERGLLSSTDSWWRLDRPFASKVK